MDKDVHNSFTHDIKKLETNQNPTINGRAKQILCINTLEYSVPPVNDKNLVCTEAGGVSKGGKCEINFYTLLLSL